MNASERWVAALLDRRRAVLVAAALLLAVVAPGALRLETDNSPPVWFVEADDDVEHWRQFQRQFGTDDGLRVVLEGDSIWTAAGLSRLARIEREAAQLSGVVDAASLVRHHRPDLERFPPDDLHGFRARVLANPLDRAVGWTTADGGAVSVVVGTEMLTPGAAAALVHSLEQIAAPTAGEISTAPLRVTVLGSRSLELALDRSSAEIGRRHLPALLLIALLLLVAVLRDTRALAVPLGFVFFCEAIALGALGWAGARLHLVLAILPPLVFVIALATSVHVLLPFRARCAEGRTPAEAVRAVWRDKGRALLWTGLSTAIGFGGLALSPVPPVATLGRWAGLALLVQTAAAFTLLPAWLARSGRARRAAGAGARTIERRLEALGGRLAAWSVRGRRWVLLLWGGGALVAAVGLPRLAPQSDALRYLAPDHPVRVDWERLERLGLGLVTLELDVGPPRAESGQSYWRSAAGLAALSTLTTELRSASIDGLLGAVGAGDLAADLGARSPFAVLASPAESIAVGAALLESDAEGARALARWVTPDGERARVTLFVRAGGYEAIDAIQRRVRAVAGRALPDGSELIVTGTLPLLLDFHRYLLTTLGLSLAFTLPLLAAVFAVLLRRWRDVLRALVPNVVPVLLLLGGMGWCGIGLDVATAMVASIVLGLVVDDTIHTLARHRERRAEVGAEQAIVERLERTAPAYLLTGTILAAGFGVCALSQFAPIAHFGALSALTVVIAVLADLTLVPALFGRDGSSTHTAKRLGASSHTINTYRHVPTGR